MITLVATLVIALSGPGTFRPRMTRDGLVTNEVAARGGKTKGVRRSPDWVATSGSLFAVAGMGWTGKPDDVAPDAQSRTGTDSAVFRLITRRRDFGGVRISFDLKVEQLVSTARTPPQDYDGLHLLVRYQSPQELYAISLQRRDGTIAIKRKSPGGPSNGGTYTQLAVGEYPLVNSWIHVDVTVTDAADGAVQLDVRIDGKLVMLALDRAVERIWRPGAIGLRGDNAEFYFRDLVAEPPVE